MTKPGLFSNASLDHLSAHFEDAVREGGHERVEKHHPGIASRTASDLAKQYSLTDGGTYY